jgi:hypothetical protein
MPFPKGQPSPFKGKHHTPEARLKMSATQFKKGQVSPMKGKKRPDLVDNNLHGFKKGQPAWNKGVTGVFHHSEETRQKISQSTKGEGGNNWKGGITPANKLGRTGVEYTAWQTAVFARDNYACQVCDQYNGYLHADHIKSWSECPELRYDVANGRTLCRPCHYYITFKRKMPSTSRWGLVNRA